MRGLIVIQERLVSWGNRFGKQVCRDPTWPNTRAMWIIISRENLSKAKGTQESMTHTELHSVHMNSVQLCLCAVLHRQKLCLARKHAHGLQHSKRGRESSAGSGHSAVTIPPSLLIHKTKMLCQHQPTWVKGGVHCSAVWEISCCSSTVLSPKSPLLTSLTFLDLTKFPLVTPYTYISSV